MGFDAATTSLRFDRLNREPFAAQIFRLATNAREDFSVRIGIYGSWGTGKTSIMKFVDEMLRAEGHDPMWFNPWGYTSKIELWNVFIGELSTRLNKISPAAAKALGHRKLNTLLHRFLSWICGFHPILAHLGAYTLDRFKRRLDDAKPKIIKAMLSCNKRVIVFVDDLDRADPRAASEMLFVLKEILDLPSFVFIFGIDPDHLKANAKNVPGLSAGLPFLEKIIEFPLWLPEVANDDIWNLTLEERQLSCPFIPVFAFEQIRSVLPENPRALKQFVRRFSSFDKEVERYAESEIDLALLVAVHLLKNQFPYFSQRVLVSKESWDGVASSILDNMVVSEGKENRRVKKEKALSDICKELGASGASYSVPVIRELIAIIARQASFYGYQEVFVHATIAERPPILTRREFEKCLSDFRSNGTSGLTTWIASHAKYRKAAERTVVGAVFELAVDARKNVTQLVYSSRIAGELNVQIAEIKILMELLRAISFNFNGFIGDAPILSATELTSLYQVLAGGADIHDNDLEKLERDFAAELATRTTLPPNELMMYPLAIQAGPNPAPKSARSEEVWGILMAEMERRLAEDIHDLFCKKGAIRAVLKNGPPTPFRHVFFRDDGALWQNPATLYEILDQANVRLEIQDNALAVIEEIREWGKHLRPDRHELLLPAEIVMKFWKAATATSISDIYQTRIDETRKLFDEWWSIELD